MAPVALENCIACEQESPSWSWGMKMIWFIITIVTHIKYECCHVPVEPVSYYTSRRFTRKWTSDKRCGKRGKTVRRLERDRNSTSEEDSQERTVGGEVTGEHEVPWMVALLRQDGTWDGCGGVLLNCDPPIIVTAAHCVQRSIQP